jgi:uncharacterized protein with HEPN domain
MSRSPARRLEDILLACDAIDAHLRRGPAGDPFADGLVFDAVRVRLIEIGEAAKDLPADLTATEPDLPWREIAGMRDQLAHRYFDTSHAILTRDGAQRPARAPRRRRTAACQRRSTVTNGIPVSGVGYHRESVP